MEATEKPIFYQDPAGVVHACRGSRLVPGDPTTYVLWTICSFDVPANQGYHRPGERVTCPTCNAKEATDAKA